MRLQNLLESVGDVWVIILDLNGGHFADDDVFENMEIFSTESKCIDRIFEHYVKAADDENEEDILAELKKYRTRANTVEKALTITDAFESLNHLQDVLLVKKIQIK